jgi:hypothetical protein
MAHCSMNPTAVLLWSGPLLEPSLRLLGRD